ncbi:exosortase A, partial [Thiohalorhabdus sp.]
MQVQVHMPDSPEPDTSAARRWAVYGALVAAVLAVLLAAYWATAVSIAAIWMRSETYAHGFFILPISGFLVWRRRGALARITPRIQWLGLLGVVAAVLLWLAGDAAEVLGAKQFAVVALIPAVTWALLGTQVVWAIAFPLVFLVFAVPWGQFLVPDLQDFTAWFSVRGLELTGIPVFWEGRMITIPAGDFEVAEACSGIRYVIASLALGCLYAYITYRGPWKRLAFIALALIVPILANGLRAYGIIMIAHWSDMGLATGVDHLIYGWVFFGVVMLILFWIGSLWADRPGVPEDPALRAGQVRATGSASLAVVTLLVLGLGVAGPVAAAWTDALQRQLETRVALPSANGGWQGPMAPVSPWEPGFQGHDVTRHRLYRQEGDAAAVQVLVIHYRWERQGAELVNEQNRLQGEQWHRVAATTRQPALAGGNNIGV